MLQCETSSSCFGKKGCCSVKLAVCVLEKKVAYSTDTSSGLFGKTIAASLNGQILFRKKFAATGQFLLVERKLLQC